MDYIANPANSLHVPIECRGQRLDQVLAHLRPEHSRSRLQNWIREGRVLVDGRIVNEPKRKLSGGELVEVSETEDPIKLSSQPENIELDIIFEDSALLVINKPAGLVVHPGNGNWSGTLQNALLHHVPTAESIPRAGIVHRLDKDTTGLMVVARTLASQTSLVRQLQARTVKRYYCALARGRVEHGGVIDEPVARHQSQRTKMAVARNGKPARTHYRVAERFIDCTLLNCALETGRTHQIRVHMAHMGHPLVGDSVYGGNVSRTPRGPLFHRQALHAWRLELTHPESGEHMSWKVPMPDDMAGLIEAVRKGTALADLTSDSGEKGFNYE